MNLSILTAPKRHPDVSNLITAIYIWKKKNYVASLSYR